METPLFVLLFSSAAINMWHNQVASLISDGPAKKSMKPETHTFSLFYPQKNVACSRRASIFDVSAPPPFLCRSQSFDFPDRKRSVPRIWETLFRPKMASPAGVSQWHSRFEYGREQHRIANRFNCPLPPLSLIQLQFRVNCKMAKHLGETTLPAE